MADVEKPIEYKLSDAVSLFNQQVTINYSLWALFVVVIFSFSSFGSSSKISFFTAGLITPGFLAFTSSNIYLIRRSLLLQIELKKDIKASLSVGRAGNFSGSLQQLIDPYGSLMASYVVHGIIDTCALSVIWYRAYTNEAAPICA